jgi:hypothetical protein
MFSTNRGASGRTNFAIDGILRGLIESFAARTTNLAVHYVVAATQVPGVADVARPVKTSCLNTETTEWELIR